MEKSKIRKLCLREHGFGSCMKIAKEIAIGQLLSELKN